MEYIKTKSKEEFLQHEYDTHFVDILELRETYMRYVVFVWFAI